MNRLKSVFIALYPLLGTATIVVSAWQILQGASWLIWLGPLLAALPFIAFLARAMLLRNVARTSSRLPVLLGMAALGVALSASEGTIGLAFLLALTSATSLVLYSFWYSDLGRAPSQALKVGAKLAPLIFVDTDGDTFETSNLLGHPALIFFFRGNWCPLCMAQIKEVAARYRELDELGVQVLMISPQPQGHTRSLARRFDAPFKFLQDVDGNAANSLGLVAKNGLPLGMQVLGYESDTVLPTVIVLDAEGVVRWCDETDNYRVRPEPETFLPMLRELSRG